MFRKWFLRSLILSELSKIDVPQMDQDLITLGLLESLKIGKNGKIDIVLLKKKIDDSILKNLIRICEKRILSLSKVQTVTIRVRGLDMKKTKTETVNGLSQVKNIIAIASGKGGVGKSTTSLGLAFALRKQGFKVGLIDADIYGPSLQSMSKAQNPETMNESLIVPPEVSGIKVMSAAMFSKEGKANILRGPMAAQFVTRLLTQADWTDLDYLLIDYPPGTGDIQLSISQNVQLTGAIIVSTPQKVAIQDAIKAMYMFQTLKVPILGAVETMSYFVCDGCEKKHYIFSKEGTKKMANEFGISFLGEIPLDEKMTARGDGGSMLDLENFVSEDYFVHIASSLHSTLQSQQKDPQALNSFKLTWQTGS